MRKRSSTPAKGRKQPKRRATDASGSEHDWSSDGASPSKSPRQRSGPIQSWTDSLQWIFPCQPLARRHLHVAPFFCGQRDKLGTPIRLDGVSLMICSFLGAMSVADRGWMTLVLASFLSSFGGGAYCSVIKWALYGEDLKFSFFDPTACLMWAVGLIIFVFGMTPYELDVWSRSTLFAFLTSWNTGILASFSASLFKKDFYLIPVLVYLYCYGGGDTSNLMIHGRPSLSDSKMNDWVLLTLVTATNLIIEHARPRRSTVLPVISSSAIYFSFAMAEKYHSFDAVAGIRSAFALKV